MTKLSIFDKIEELKKYTSLSQNDKIKHFWQNWRSEKNPWSFHKMTKLSIFDNIEEAKKSTGLSENDKIEHFWQNWKSEKKYKGLSENDKTGRFWQIWRSEKIHGPLRKWQNGQFLTILKKWKTIRASHFMGKIERFWQNWRSEKIHRPLRKWWERGVEVDSRTSSRVG